MKLPTKTACPIEQERTFYILKQLLLFGKKFLQKMGSCLHILQMTVYRLVRNSDTAHNKNVACEKIASTNATSFLAY